jgi:tetratricopeptide (TPR) repeat protein
VASTASSRASREVAYSTLSKRDRRSRHLAAARYFEALGDDELAGVLAMHYLDAWKAAPEGAEGAAIGAQARVALRAAAERASVLHSPEQALSYLKELLAVTSDPAERASASERASAAAELAARFEQQEQYATAASEAYRGLGDVSGLARATSLLARSHLARAHLDAGLEIAKPVLAEVEALENDPGVVDLIATIARMHGLRGDNELAVQLADRALILAEPLDLVEIIAGAVMTKGVSLAYLQRNREAMILLPGVLLLAESHGLLTTEARARLNISQFGIVDQPAQSLAVARLGTERAQKMGLRQWEPLLAGNAVMAALHTGDWDWAIKTSAEVMRDAPIAAENSEVHAYPSIMLGLRGDGGERLSVHIEAYEPIAAGAGQDPQYWTLLIVLRCWLHFIRGDLERAAEQLVTGDVLEPTYASANYSLAGHAALWLRDRDRAARVLDLFNALTLRGVWLEAARRSLAAGVAALDGRTAEAVGAFAEQVQAMRENGMAFDVALALMDEVASVGVVEPAGRAAANEAREILTRLGATVLVDRLDQLTATQSPAAAPTKAEAISTPVETTA